VQCGSRVSNARRSWSSLGPLPPHSSPRKHEHGKECCTGDIIHHSCELSGDGERSCSMFGRDLVVGGEEALDGGDVASDSDPSSAASALSMT